MINATLYQQLIKSLKEVKSSGPRYTSYPTVPEWGTWGSEEYKTILNNAKKSEFSLYLHFPYCKTKCLFCACNAYISNNVEVRRNYLRHLTKEIEMHAPLLGNKKIRHLHLGGGTPTYLSDQELEDILVALFNNYSFIDNPEKSVEIDPRTFSTSKIKILKDFGFNRVSFGIQDFDESVQNFINRQHSREEIANVLDETRNSGIENINLDIIYGLNHQTTSSWETTLKSVLSLKPSRIASYSFANVPWKKKHQLILNEGVVSAEDKIKMLLITKDFFQKNGYESIGIDHFALPNDPLAIAQKEHKLYRNFMGYTDNNHGDYFGFGCSSIGWTSEAYFQNEVTPDNYIKKIGENQFATTKGIHLTNDDKIRQKIIQEVMNYGSLNFKEIESEFKIDFKSYFANELLEIQNLPQFAQSNNEGISLTEVGNYFTRNIAMVFDAYLKKSVNQFSSTV
jgi:oxygen-independent coproporphyrinogen-3 oxidase